MSLAWPEVSLGEICEFRYGKSLPEARRSGTGFGVFGSNGPVGSHKKPLTSGATIVVGRKGSFGEVTYSTEACWPIDTTYYIDATCTSVDLRWLYYRMKALPLTELNRAAAIPGLNREDAYRQRLSLPPFREQQRIAEILDQADSLRVKAQASLESLDILVQSSFTEMYSAQSWLGSENRSLGDVCDIQAGYPFKSALYDSDINSVRLCRGANVLPGRIDWTALCRYPATLSKELVQYRLMPDDVVIAMDRPWIGEGFKVAMVRPLDAEALLVQRVARLRVEREVSAFFVYWLLRQRSFERYCKPTETTIPHISPVEIRKFEFTLPDVKSMATFTEVARRVEGLRIHSMAAIELLGALFDSLQHRAFRGEL